MTIRFRLQMPVCILLIWMFGNIPARGQQPARTDREERMDRILDTLALSLPKCEKMLVHVRNVKTSFNKILQIQNEIEKEDSTTAESLGKALKDESRAYTKSLDMSLKDLGGMLDEKGISLLYRYLRDELWYEGFITESTVLARPSIGFDTHPKVAEMDTATFIKKYGRAVFLDMLRERDLKPGEKLPDKKELYPEQKPETVKAISPTDEPTASLPKVPPWDGLPLPPANLESLRALLSLRGFGLEPDGTVWETDLGLKGKTEGMLTFYWLDLAPIAEKAVQKKMESSGSKNSPK